MSNQASRMSNQASRMSNTPAAGGGSMDTPPVSRPPSRMSNQAIVFVIKQEAPKGGYYWSVSRLGGGGSKRTEAGVETTALKAWRKACRVARDDFGFR